MKKILILGFILSSGLLLAQVPEYKNRTALSDSVNSREDESAAILSPDGNTLYYVRSFFDGKAGSGSANQDIFYSMKLPGGKWSAAVSIGAPLNDEFNNAVCGISRDGKRLYLNNIKVRQDKVIPGISVSVLGRDGWEMPTPVSSYEFPEKGFFQPFVSPDEDFAIVSFEGPKSEGLEDLYIMKKNALGKFDNPVHMGEKVNSSGFETSPIVGPDGKTLYFSSNGFGGQGDGDIYVATRLDDSWTNWTNPENLGNRINTIGFDGSFNLNEENHGYYVSGDGNAGPGNIYVISMTPPPPPPAPVALPEPEQKMVAESTEPAGTKPDRIDTLGTAYFEFNSVIIKPDSEKTLRKVAKNLKSNAKYFIEVDGHTDSKGSEDYNQKLSERRAGSVMRFLVRNGVNPRRIRAKGFGELNPIDDNETEEGRSRNRRVEIKYFLK
jgi:outer membrane protein OmpA-like peptidoglycan-associated protein